MWSGKAREKNNMKHHNLPENQSSGWFFFVSHRPVLPYSAPSAHPFRAASQRNSISLIMIFSLLFLSTLKNMSFDPIFWGSVPPKSPLTIFSRKSTQKIQGIPIFSLSSCILTLRAFARGQKRAQLTRKRRLLPGQLIANKVGFKQN